MPQPSPPGVQPLPVIHVQETTTRAPKLGLVGARREQFHSRRRPQVGPRTWLTVDIIEVISAAICSMSRRASCTPTVTRSFSGRESMARSTTDARCSAIRSAASASRKVTNSGSTPPSIPPSRSARILVTTVSYKPRGRGGTAPGKVFKPLPARICRFKLKPHVA